MAVAGLAQHGVGGCAPRVRELGGDNPCTVTSLVRQLEALPSATELRLGVTAAKSFWAKLAISTSLAWLLSAKSIEPDGWEHGTADGEGDQSDDKLCLFESSVAAQGVSSDDVRRTGSGMVVASL